MAKKPDALKIAIELAMEAGRIQMDYLGKMHDIEFKSAIDIVTEVDRKCEDAIVRRLRKDFPTYNVIAEEGTNVKGSSEWCWLVDPLDGTVNYNHTYPLFGPSIALEHRGEVVLGVVYEPFMEEMFVAEKGGGATLNGKKISVSQTERLKHSLLSTGFAYNVTEEDWSTSLELFGRLNTRSRAVRRDGMAAGDLCSVACGRFDCYWERFLKPWDIAAGVLVVQEAGGHVTGFDGSPVDIYGKTVVASNGLVHDEVIHVLNKRG